MWVRERRIRWALQLAGAAAIAAMFVYVVALPLPDDAGANIGAGVLFLWLLVSLGLLGLGAARELWGSERDPATSPRPERSHTWAKVAIASSVLVVLFPLSVVLVLVPLAAAALSWSREPPSRLRLVATALAALATLYLLF